MKHILGLTLIAVALSYVSCEQCTVSTDCTITICGVSITVCQHRYGVAVANGGLCTCSDAAAKKCVLAADCYDGNAPNLSCPNHQRHCYDGNCICSRYPTGK